MMRLLGRDFRLMRSSSGSLWSSAAVFVLICVTFAVGLGASAPVLTAVGPGVLWSAATLAVMMLAPSIFVVDIESGALDYLRLDGHTLSQVAGSKLVATAIFVLLPLLFAAVLVGSIYGMSWDQIRRLVLSLAVGGPSLVAYCVFAGALLAGWGRGSLLSLILTLPLLLPVIIFGEAAAASHDAGAALKALVGLSLVSVVLSTVASAAALGINAE